jgi:hypothetical protein
MRTKWPEKTLEKRFNDVIMALMEVQLDASYRGFKRGNGGNGEVKCPICPDGIIKYSVADLNGHIWGCCRTKNCVRWMQ